MADLTQFDLGSAARVARVVRAVEQEPRRTRPLTFSPVIEAGRRKVFRVCTFTGAWTINSAKTVTYKYQTATPNTVVAMNLFATLGTAASSRNCAIAREGTAWYLIAAEC